MYKKYKNFLGFVIAMVVAGVILIGCGSSDEKFESAHDKLQDNSEDLNTIIENQANAKEQKAVIAKEWIEIKSEADSRIKNVDSAILELKTKMQMKGKMLDAFYTKQIPAVYQKV